MPTCFCTADQLAAELGATVKLTRQVLEILGMMDYRVRVGLRDPGSAKYVGTAESWDRAEAAIRSAAQDSGVSYVEEPGRGGVLTGPRSTSSSRTALVAVGNWERFRSTTTCLNGSN